MVFSDVWFLYGFLSDVSPKIENGIMFWHRAIAQSSKMNVYSKAPKMLSLFDQIFFSFISCDMILWEIIVEVTCEKKSEKES